MKWRDDMRARKILSVMLVMVMMIGMMNGLKFNMLRVKAETLSGYCGTTENGADGTNLQWSLNTETGELTITGSGAMESYSNSDENLAPWYEHRQSITSIVFPNNLTVIGSYAFYECTNLPEIVIPNSVINIERGAYSGCSGATGTLTIPNSVRQISMIAFENCSGLTGDVIIPAGVTLVSANPFLGCTGLTGFIVDSGNTYYDSRDNCNAIIRTQSNNLICGCQNTVIPNTVTTIADSAFRKCTTLTGSLTIPSSVTQIGSSAFMGCTGLTGNLIIPDSVTDVDEYAFRGCTGFTGTLTISNNLTVINNFMFDGCTGLSGNLVIPNGVTSIGDCAFRNCSNLIGGLSISSNVVNIGYSAFQGCSGLTGNLTIPNNVMNLGEKAFYQCAGFTGTLTISNNLTEIGLGTFASCNNLTGSLTIPSSVTTIGSSAFASCNSLTGDLIIPNTVTSIGSGAFQNCRGFTGRLSISENITTIEKSTFRSCGGLTGNLIIPDSVTSIGANAFLACGGFTGDLVIPDSVTSIGTDAFRSCPGFNGSLIISANLTTIEEGVFRSSYGLKGELKIPDGVTSIKERAFSTCAGLSGKINIPDGVIDIGLEAFLNCYKYTSITIPDSVEEIGENAFNGCTGVKYIVVHPDETDISLAGVREQAAIYCNEGSDAESFAIDNNRTYGRIGTADNDWQTCWDLNAGECWQYLANGASTDEVLYLNGQTMSTGTTITLEKSTAYEYDFQAKTPDFTATKTGAYHVEFKNLETSKTPTRTTYIEVYKKATNRDNDTLIANTSSVALTSGIEKTYEADLELNAGDTVYVKYIESYAGAGERQLSAAITLSSTDLTMTNDGTDVIASWPAASQTELASVTSATIRYTKSDGTTVTRALSGTNVTEYTFEDTLMNDSDVLVQFTDSQNNTYTRATGKAQADLVVTELYGGDNPADHDIYFGKSNNMYAVVKNIGTAAISFASGVQTQNFAVNLYETGTNYVTPLGNSEWVNGTCNTALIPNQTETVYSGTFNPQTAGEYQIDVWVNQTEKAEESDMENNKKTFTVEIIKSGVDVIGYQMNTNMEEGGVSENMPSFRVLSKATKKYVINGQKYNVKSYGTIYALTDSAESVDEEAMVLGSEDEFIKSADCTEYNVTWGGEERKANIYPMTLKQTNYRYSQLTTPYSFRAYAIVEVPGEDDIIVYSKIYTIDSYEIADDLYQNQKMHTLSDHNYLYDNILNIVKMYQNKQDIGRAMSRLLGITGKDDPKYDLVNKLYKDLHYYATCTQGYTYQGRARTVGSEHRFRSIQLGDEGEGTLLDYLNEAADPATEYTTLFDWILNETSNITDANNRPYKGFYEKVPYNWDNNIYKDYNYE